MKKLLFIFVTLVFSIGLFSCVEIEDDRVLSLIMPSGTPSLALATYAKEGKDRGKLEYEIVAGSDPLVAAFTSASHDVIVAPVNLGAKLYKTYGNYCLYKTIVWGNVYLASKGTLSSLSDLNGKTVTCFGKNSTPDIVLQAILKNHPEINVTVEYVADVAEANTALATNKAEIIVSAEPSLTKLKDKFGLSIIDLQTEWEKMTGNASYPQAAIFVKKEIAKHSFVKEELQKMVNAVVATNESPSTTASIAVGIHASFETLGVDTLTASIPYCHFQVLDTDKEAVNYYLQMMMDLGFGKQMGESLPDDDFYL